MSRLTDLIAQLGESQPALAEDLRREVEVLGARRPFGLNFERHVPETIELPDRKVRRGDKVVIRAADEPPDRRIWIVTGWKGRGPDREAELTLLRDREEQTLRPVSDLNVIAEFRDPIYPGLRSTGNLSRGGEKPFHSIIKGENFHVLEALTFAYKHRVDCIYIDPPYNTRDKDWKYNNDYVDTDDAYRHSKWLAMMERRLQVAKELLNPDDSCLIVTIDEKECHRLALLLDQVFPHGTKTMVSCVINPKGVPSNGFSRVNEFVFFIAFGNFGVESFADDFLSEVDQSPGRKVRWRGLARSGANATRTKSPGAYYPIFIDVETGEIRGAGPVVRSGESESEAPVPEGTVAVWPTPRPSGEPGRWSVVLDTFESLLAKGAVKTGKVNVAKGLFPMSYLTSEQLDQIDTGMIEIIGRREDGALEVQYADGNKTFPPKTVWRRTAHSASDHGSTLLRDFIPDRSFPYPKSLYAVEDVLRIAVGNKPNAIVLDFFAGSGTTSHAVFRLNRQDSGRRQSISVTNNELSDEEARACAADGLRPGDPGWERWGIFEHITRPRIEAAVTGKRADGEPVRGFYSFTDEFSMEEGFEENVEFFELTYEDPENVAYGLSFGPVSPLLWMRAGTIGDRITEPESGFALTSVYGVLFDIDVVGSFLKAVEAAPRLRLAYLLTDDESQFQVVADRLPSRVTSMRLYSAYLNNFRRLKRD